MLLNGKPAMGPAGMLYSFDEKVDSAMVHIIGQSNDSSFFIVEKSVKHQSITCKMKQKKLNLADSCGCHLLKDFNAGEQLGHNEKFAILTNLIQINGGTKYFFAILDKFYDETCCTKWRKDIRYIKGYMPKKCSPEFCSYYASCENEGNIVNTLSMDRKIRREEETCCSIEEAEENLKNNLEDAFNSGVLGIHMIRAQTAIGKTTAYMNLMAEHPDTKFIVALPTNILKHQVGMDLRNKGIPPESIFVTPSIQGNSLLPQDIQDAVSGEHNRGIHNRTKKIISDFKEDVENRPGMLAETLECQKILDGIHGIQGERIVVTTHAYFLQMPEDFLKDYTVIVDEDILQLQIFNRIYGISKECLEELAGKGFPYYSRLAARILGAEDGKYMKIDGPSYEFPLEEEQLNQLECFGYDNINDMGCAGSFVKLRDGEDGRIYVKYFCPKMLHYGKYIVLSATLNEQIYRKYFQGNMKVYLYPEKKAAYKGKLVQYTYHSLGRGDLSSKMQVFDYARDIAEQPDLPIITFKKYGRMNSQDLHFGNSTGINALEGRDIGIVGTPFKAEEAYKLVACYLGADVNQETDGRPRMRRVTYRSCSFLITTYKEPLLREIQLYSLESELEQCVGRARLLRRGCTVYLFSAFPCEQAKIHMKNYLL